MTNHILIGLGGTGYKVLRDFRKRLWTEVPNINDRNKLPIKFLYVDSDEDSTPSKLAGNPDLRVNGQDTAITPDEYLGIKNVNLDSVFSNIQQYPRLRHVIGNGEYIRNSLGEVGKAAGQKRRAGRILFAQNAPEYLNKVRHMIQSVGNNVGNREEVNIYIFTGLAGGTGSGAIVDAVSLLLSDTQLNQYDPKIEVFAMLPETLPPAGADAGRYHANGYAALTELSALNVGAFLPADVRSGNEHIVLNHPDYNKQFGLTVYTNENRSKAVVDSYTVLPQLVADMMYFRIFSPQSEAMMHLTRFLRNENRPNFLVEYKTTTREGKPIERVRTKAVGSFGIKRVRYPNDKLIAMASETIARDALKMFLYMNFDADTGYLNEPKKESKDYNEYLKRENLRNWKLSAADLSLSSPILMPTDGKTPPSFHEYWDSVSLDYDYRTASNLGHPLQILEQYFEDRYKGESPEDTFREEKGIEDYFIAKSRDQIITDSANAIVNKISENLFTQWQQGVYSAYDIRQIAERILSMLREKNNAIEANAQELEDQIARNDKTLEEIFDDFGDVRIIIEWIARKRRDLFVEYSKTLAEKYEAKTRLASLQIFQRKLLPKLVQQFTNLQSEIQDFVARNQMIVEGYGTLIAERTPAPTPDLRLANVEVTDLDRLENFISDLLHDRDKMELLSQKIRDYLSDGAGKSFDRLCKKMTSQSELEDMAVNVLQDSILSYHTEILREKPVLGMNVLEQLYQMYGDNDDAIGKFATELVSNSDVYINLNDQEVKKMMPNTENPDTTPAAGPNSIMLVALPHINTDDDKLKRFLEKLKIKLEQSFNKSETRNFLIMESLRSDEITIISYQNLFPIRAIDSMPFLKQKYEELIKSPNESTNQTNKILLHSEGDGSQLPPLFGEGTGPTGDELIKYIFLAVSYGIIKQGIDEMGNSGWGTVIADEFGVESFTFISNTFTGILTSRERTPEMTADIVEKIDEEILKPIHVTQKSEMSQKVKDLMKNSVLPEVGSPSNEVYKRYATQAKEALKVFV